MVLGNPPQVGDIWRECEKYSTIYYFMLALSGRVCYTLHSELGIFTFSEDRQMECLLLLAFWVWLLKDKSGD